MPHNLILSRGAATLLASVLTAPGALTTLKGKFAAGELLSKKLVDIPKVSEGNFETWAKGDWQTIELTEAERDASKKAVEWCVTSGAVPAGEHLNSLLSQLGLVE